MWKPMLPAAAGLAPVLAASLVLGLAIPAAPADAHPHDPSEPDAPLSERIEGIFRDLMESVEPTIDELRETLRVFERIDSLEHYESPEILPNGDIVIRRREDAPPYEPPQSPEEAPDAQPRDLGPGVRI